MDTLTTNVGKVDATRHVEAVRRRWRLVAAVTATFLVAAALLTFVSTPAYESSTSVLVAPVPASTDADVANSRTRGEINLDTEAQIIRSVALAEDVASRIGSDVSASKIASSVSVTVPANSQVLRITFVAPTAQGAQAGAEAYAQAYLDQRRVGSEQTLEQAKQGIQRELDSLEDQFVTQTELSRDASLTEVDRAIATSRREVLVGQISTLDSNLATLARTSINPGSVLSAANLPPSPTSPSLSINLAAGLVLGLLAGVGAAVAVGRFDHRIHSPSEIRVPRNVQVYEDVLIATTSADDFDPRIDEQANQLRIDIDSAGDDDPRTVLVAALGEDSGSEWIALSLGRAYARRLGTAVYAVADSTSPITQELGIGGPGLTDLISGERAVGPLKVAHSELAAVGPGSIPGRLSGLLQRPDALDKMLRLSDGVLIVATPALHQSAGARALLGAMDRVLLVGRCGAVDERQLARTIESLERSHFRGTVSVALIEGHRSQQNDHLRGERDGPREADRDTDDRPDRGEGRSVPAAPVSNGSRQAVRSTQARDRGRPPAAISKSSSSR